MAPTGRDGDRLFISPNGLLDRASFVQYLDRCADDWMRVANGSFYGITRKSVDTAAVAQSHAVRAKAREIEKDRPHAEKN